MINRFSVVIVCKNEAHVIQRVLDSVSSLSDDVVVYDNGSTDGTIDILKKYKVRIHDGEWYGYGKTKKIAVNLAKYDWVLSIDADEALDDTLQKELSQLQPEKKTMYKVRFKNFLGNRYLRWGEWGMDKHIRLFNRLYVNWNEAEIHEELVMSETCKTIVLGGYIHHYTMKDTAEYSQKMVKYALLNADKYFAEGKRSTYIKRFINPGFAFVKHFILQLGFLDGWEGLLSAKMSSFYTTLKYARLHELWEQDKNKDLIS